MNFNQASKLPKQEIEVIPENPKLLDLVEQIIHLNKRIVEINACLANRLSDTKFIIKEKT